jgi:hypothetical protein
VTSANISRSSERVSLVYCGYSGSQARDPGYLLVISVVSDPYDPVALTQPASKELLKGTQREALATTVLKCDHTRFSATPSLEPGLDTIYVAWKWEREGFSEPLYHTNHEIVFTRSGCTVFQDAGVA